MAREQVQVRALFDTQAQGALDGLPSSEPKSLIALGRLEPGGTECKRLSAWLREGIWLE